MSTPDPSEAELLQSEDGSFTLFLPSLKETYHSRHGAIQESQHVFIQHGLSHLLKSTSTINLLEIGLGTGLNALLTLKEQLKLSFQINYHSLEPFPLATEITSQLNYADSSLLAHFDQIHQCPWDKDIVLSSGFTFRKFKTRLQDFESPEAFYHLIYFDAFAPGKQPELWEKEIFDKLYRLAAPGALLVTYCAQGQFKRHLKAAGFKVEALPGPPGKKEMTRAFKENNGSHTSIKLNTELHNGTH